MNWNDFFMGVVMTVFTYVVFTHKQEEEEIEEQGGDMEVHDFQSRHVTLSCQTCRKLKKHKEVEPGIFQCVKCKRHVDIRVS